MCLNAVDCYVRFGTAHVAERKIGACKRGWGKILTSAVVPLQVFKTGELSLTATAFEAPGLFRRPDSDFAGYLRRGHVLMWNVHL